MTARPTPAWDPQQLARMDRSSRKWAASARTAAQGWAAQLLDLALCLTSLIGISWDANTLCGYG